MNIRDLKYLIAVVESEHFGQAAERCCVSQPTLSMQLKKLEEELGVQLFERTNKCVMTTPIGKQLAEQAKRILGEINTLKNIASNSKDPLCGDFRLGIIPTMGPYLLPQLLSALKKHLPKLNLIVYENKTENILKELHTGLLDAVILALPVEKDGLVCHELFREKFILALPKGHKLVKKSNVHLDDIKHEELLLLEDGHCLREQIMDACHMLSSQEKTGFKATSLETLKHLVASGLGVTLLPEMMVEKSAKNSGQVVLKHFAKPEPCRKIAMLWRKNSARVVCCEKLWKLFSE